MFSTQGVVRLGSLKKNGYEVIIPTKPWYSGNCINSNLRSKGKGDIPSYLSLPDMKKWTIGNTSDNPLKQLQWAKISENDKVLLICDRVILNEVTWDELNNEGYITGKEISIDGKKYLCRVLTGGSTYNNKDNCYTGGAVGNEWDKYINDKEYEFNKNLNAHDFNSSHNQFWNWIGNFSWCQERFQDTINSPYTHYVMRGYASSHYYYYCSNTLRLKNLGWRPVLEEMNS